MCAVSACKKLQENQNNPTFIETSKEQFMGKFQFSPETCQFFLKYKLLSFFLKFRIFVLYIGFMHAFEFLMFGFILYINTCMYLYILRVQHCPSNSYLLTHVVRYSYLIRI